MATTERPYCGVGDLHITEGIELHPGLDLSAIILQVAEEMDSHLGFIYVVPFVDLAPHEVLLLKQINAKLATARVLLSTYGEAGEDGLHGYGMMLLREGQDKLMKLSNGLIDLHAERNTDNVLDRHRGPVATNTDEESGVDIFEAIVFRGERGYWQPGMVKDQGFY